MTGSTPNQYFLYFQASSIFPCPCLAFLLRSDFVWTQRQGVVYPGLDPAAEKTKQERQTKRDVAAEDLFLMIC